MRLKKRNEDLIASQILNICRNGAGKTRILYQANLNSSKVNHYLDNMKKNGFIAEVVLGSRIQYKTTQKGAELMMRIDRLQSEMDELHAHLFEVEL